MESWQAEGRQLRNRKRGVRHIQRSKYVAPEAFSQLFRFVQTGAFLKDQSQENVTDIRIDHLLSRLCHGRCVIETIIKVISGQMVFVRYLSREPAGVKEKLAYGGSIP